MGARAINTSAVPEAEAHILTLVGLGLIGLLHKRRKKVN